MTSTLVDSNVLIDVTDPASTWSDWSVEQIAAAADIGPMILSPIVYSELAGYFESAGAADAAVFSEFVREPIPWAAAFRAGQTHRLYRSRGGSRERTLPDFLVGAHAAVKGHRLLTRDARRYRAYFPTLDIIAPDTHP